LTFTTAAALDCMKEGGRNKAFSMKGDTYAHFMWTKIRQQTALAVQGCLMLELYT
jgi:hypothetical protein